MTHATKAIYKLLLSDYVKVSKVSVEDMLYDEQDIYHLGHTYKLIVKFKLMLKITMSIKIRN